MSLTEAEDRPCCKLPHISLVNGGGVWLLQPGHLVA